MAETTDKEAQAAEDWFAWSVPFREAALARTKAPTMGTFSVRLEELLETPIEASSTLSEGAS